MPGNQVADQQWVAVLVEVGDAVEGVKAGRGGGRGVGDVVEQADALSELDVGGDMPSGGPQHGYGRPGGYEPAGAVSDRRGAC